MINSVYTSGDFISLSATHCCGAIVVEGITDDMEFSSWADHCEAGWLEDEPEQIVLDLVRSTMNRGYMQMHKNLLTMYDVCPIGRTHMCPACQEKENDYGYVEGGCDECEYSTPEYGDYYGAGAALADFVHADGELGSITISPWVRNTNSGNYIRGLTWILPEDDLLHKWALKHYPDVVERIRVQSGLNREWIAR